MKEEKGVFTPFYCVKKFEIIYCSMPKMLKKPHTPNQFAMEKTYIYFRSLDFYKIAILVAREEKNILLNPEQHNLLILLSEKESGCKYHRIASNLFNDLLEMYTFL